MYGECKIRRYLRKQYVGVLARIIGDQGILGQHVSKHNLALLQGKYIWFLKKWRETLKQLVNMATCVETCSGINELAPAKDINPST